MALVVEDGTGKADADAFVSVDDCDAYCAARGLTDWTGAADSPPDVKEAAIRRATGFLSTGYAWKGARTSGRSQALAWPRTDATDGEGEEIDTDELPVEVVQACCELAAYEAANPGGLTPAVTMTERVKRERVGSVEVEYAQPSLSIEAARPVLTRVSDLIGGLLTATSSSLVGSAVRS